LDKFYIPCQYIHKWSCKVLYYIIRRDGVKSYDHSIICILEVQKEPPRKSYWKMNEWDFNKVEGIVYRVWENLPQFAHFFSNMKRIINCYKGENLLRCTTHDEKGLILTTFLFYPIFWSPWKIMNQKLSKFSEGLYFKPL
jgi:hypothetical protein